MTLIEQIYDLNTQITQLDKQRGRLLQEWALEVSPWKVGDTVPVQGWSFQGKQCRVRSVVGGLTYQKAPQVIVAAIILKKDGTDSQQRASWKWQLGDAYRKA